MIEAKGTKEETVNATAARDRFVLKSGAQRLRVPVTLGGFLIAIAAYLRSVLPVQSASASEADEAAPRAPAEQDEASPADERVQSAELIEIERGEQFELVDSPVFSFRDVSGSAMAVPAGQVLRFRQSSPNEQRAGVRTGTAAVVQFPSDRTLPAETPDVGGGVEASSEGSVAGAARSSVMQPERTAPEKEDRNRAPRVTGTTYLNDVIGCTAVLISLADLLRNASDPDGDALGVRNISVSSGTLTQVDGGWLFTPAAGVLGEVVLSYEITDGQFAIPQLVSFDVVRPPPITGTSGDDTLVGTACGDDISAGDGNDAIDGRGGSDVINAGSGDDHIVCGSGDDIVTAGSGDDIVFGGDGNDVVYGGAGNDRVFGGTGSDVIFGESGNDTIEGDDGNDTLSDGEGSDVVRGGTGRDHIIVALDTANDTYDGGADVDTLDLSGTSHSVEVDLDRGEAKGDDIGVNQVSSVERVIAGTGDDDISGSAAAEELFGGAGDDVLCGEGGSDNVSGGSGDDCVVASADAANDTYDGGEGSDTLDLSFATMRLEIDLTQGRASSQEIGVDTIRNFEEVIGGQGDDLFLIGEQSTIIRGGGGQNTFVFSAVVASTDMPEAIHEILDFMVGDNIKIEKFELFRQDAGDNFQDQYSGNTHSDDERIRVRHDRVAELERTYVEADLNSDSTYEISIALHGNFAMQLSVQDT